jgi:hypothetical protein
MGRLSWLVVCVIACSAPGQPPAQPPPPAEQPARRVTSIPTTGFAQPPDGMPSAPPTPPNTAPPSALPTTGPECNKCPATAPLYPTEQCADGIHIGGRGPCMRFANGCNWSGLACPAAGATRQCTPRDCELPLPSRWQCADGSIGEVTCVATVQGTCGATYRACPFTPKVVVTPPPPPRPPSRTCDPLPPDRVLVTWPVQEICGPGQGPAPPPQRHIKTLPDGTHVIELLRQCIRARYRRCYTKCLPPEARIATPAGDLPISALRIGADVWTRDVSGRRVAGRVEQLASIAITSEHHVARLVLGDGRTVTVSPEHPVLGGRVVQELRVGEHYDGSAIVTLDLVPYRGARTHDLLPSGATGVYWADGIPMRSTLAP